MIKNMKNAKPSTYLNKNICKKWENMVKKILNFIYILKKNLKNNKKYKNYSNELFAIDNLHFTIFLIYM